MLSDCLTIGETDEVEIGGQVMRISVLGLGSMGAALAACLIKNGHHVCVWNRSAEKAAPLLAMGADVAGTAGEAVAAMVLCSTF